MAFLTALFLFFLLRIFPAAIAQPNKLNRIESGDSLSPSIQRTAWYSPSKRFAFGFLAEGTGYKVGIWIIGGPNNVTVWTANRDEAAVDSDATLEFLRGKILLKPKNGAVQTIAPPSDRALYAALLDSGNFQLYAEDQSVVWESFKFPTDTILGGQELSSGKELRSSLSPEDHSSGRFRLTMQYDGNLVAYPVNTTDYGEFAYWASNTAYWASNTANGLYNGLFLDNYTGRLLLINVSDTSLTWEIARSKISHDGKDVVYRATLDYDGNIRLYTHRFSVDGSSKTFVEWDAIPDACDVKGFCGLNSYCVPNLDDGKPACNCLPGFELRDTNQPFGGCERNFTAGGGERCINGKEDPTFYNITVVNITWNDHPYFVAALPEKEDCRVSCAEDCDCDAAVYNGYSCLKYNLPFKYLKQYCYSGDCFLKLRNIIVVPRNTSDDQKPSWVTTLALSLSFVTYSCILFAIFSIFILKLRIIKYRKQLLGTRTTGLVKEFTLQTYTYKELKKGTNNFTQELGKGSFGAVYKGSLDRARNFVAVKELQKMVEEGEREFRAEMRIIGRTRHRNLVRLLGYCIEGPKRLLVYEYMGNGSLAELLYRTRPRPDWQERFRIALDVAKGIQYLHEECDSPIIHCDIKPQNILLDDFWTAKISDFGLAKLLMPDQTRTFTGARGTRGYMAPEWDKNMPITVKVDIYSFGIVLLEIVCCRRNFEVNLSSPEETLLSSWAYQCFAAKDIYKLMADEEVDQRTFERMVTVALWCIQDEPVLRFPMKTVLLMLEGIIDVPIPPCPSSDSQT
ncbi:hypothetical protein ACH5RR_012651 [Cinchona calisaya]|uniref:Receptor-like serine/threonine-protein kinase n=1 Tax=Cinchona calisaya TaxID=153742 RepID=A0ABD3ABR6_9GENT